MKKQKKVNQRELARSNAKAAMADVRDLLKRHGSRAVNSCLKQVAAEKKARAKLEKMKAEVTELEKKFQ